MTGVLEFAFAVIILVAFFTGLTLGVWKVVHNFRRQHRLEREADERAHKKALAADFAEATKMLESGAINFRDYADEPIRQKSKRPHPA